MAFLAIIIDFGCGYPNFLTSELPSSVDINNPLAIKKWMIDEQIWSENKELMQEYDGEILILDIVDGKIVPLHRYGHKVCPVCKFGHFDLEPRPSAN